MTPESSQQANIILVGFMGTGKTALARRLAALLARPHLDTDSWIEQQAGCTIRELFETEGEAVFRALEQQAVRHAASLRGHVISTGGGVMTSDENLRLLRSAGVLICLSARPDIIVRRTRPWSSRPLLRTAPNPYLAVVRLLEERAPRYALADVQIDTSDRPPAELAAEICEKLPSLFPLISTRS